MRKWRNSKLVNIKRARLRSQEVKTEETNNRKFPSHHFLLDVKLQE
jgi:hypothetical protein